MRTPEDHAAAIAAVLPVRGTEFVPLGEALGRVLAAPFQAVADSPLFDNSQMDGFALPSTGGTYEVGPTIAAGQDPDELYPRGLGGRAAPIMTGARLPRGTVAVVAVETCEPPEFPEPGAQLRTPSAPAGQFIRRAGVDVTAGQLLIDAPLPLTPLHIGVLAGQGIEEVEVYERSSVLLCTGGAEIGGAGAASIPDVNTPLLRALCARAGIEMCGIIRTDDDPDLLVRALEGGVEKHQPTAIITSGGISAGKFEVVRQVLWDGWFGKVAQQPGGPQGISTFRGVPVISLPGNPISTLVSFRLFVAPLLGHAPAPVEVPLSADAPGLPGRDQFLRGTHHARAVPLGSAGSHFLGQAADATCLIRIPAGGLAAGENVTVYPL
ncbi:MAG: molybdopterin molybdotransferase MoeA [Corynebacterium sp.]|uniref:molybdopterin molybdotransferase MoeA n=1 Tax=Corynebacterium sp. TaxID=1720 RepID=UPI0026E02588|nr:molybdopterin molybdotransferase MoeA [Corynebacterium sp.]MDO5668427.1 molybdopterin molybdotransferase MoeA [Corynebacterium sp.]